MAREVGRANPDVMNITTAAASLSPRQSSSVFDDLAEAYAPENSLL